MAITRLEKLADLFIESYLKDHPIHFDSLDEELQEFLLEFSELRITSTINEILKEYEKSNKRKVINEQLTKEVIASGQRALENLKAEDEFVGSGLATKSPDPSKSNFNNNEPIDSSLLISLQIRREGNPLIYDLKLLVIMDNRIMVRNLHELMRADQHDLYMPNDWIYYKGSNLDDILNHVRNYYETLKKEDENEPNVFGEVFNNFDDYK